MAAVDTSPASADNNSTSLTNPVYSVEYCTNISSLDDPTNQLSYHLTASSLTTALISLPFLVIPYNCVCCSSLGIWNSLPVGITATVDYCTFKTKLSTHLSAT